MNDLVHVKHEEEWQTYKCSIGYHFLNKYMFTYYYLKIHRKKKTEGSPICWLMFQMPTRARAEPG